MLSEEEKDAIKLLKEFKKNGYTSLLMCKYDGDRTKTNKILKKATKTVLNLIEKQQKVANLQEKTIQLMAEQFEIMKDKEEAIDCFIPREYSDIDDCVKKDSCQECIIEYFRNKAKESE